MCDQDSSEAQSAIKALLWAQSAIKALLWPTPFLDVEFEHL